MAMAGISGDDDHTTCYGVLQEAGLTKLIKSIQSGDFVLNISVVDKFYTCCGNDNPFYISLMKDAKNKDGLWQYLHHFPQGVQSIDEIIGMINKSEITEKAKTEIIAKLKKTAIDFSDYRKYTQGMAVRIPKSGNVLYSGKL